MKELYSQVAEHLEHLVKDQSPLSQPLNYARMEDHVMDHDAVDHIDSVTAPPQMSVAISSQIPDLIARQFPRFPKLPLELRQMIWTLAVLTPQITTFRITPHAGVWYPSVAPSHSPIRFVNKEARRLFLRVKKPCIDLLIKLKTDAERAASVFDTCSYVEPLAPQWRNAYALAPKIFVNPAIDIIWMNTTSLKMCQMGHYWIDLQIQRLALDYEVWKRFTKVFDFPETYINKNILGLGVKEVIFVVGATSSNAPVPNIIFVKPRAPPSVVLGTRFWEGAVGREFLMSSRRRFRKYVCETELKEKCTWECLEEIVLGNVDKARQKVEELRKNNDPQRLARYPQVSIMSVKFMEAVAVTV
ncbi:uncharacterized protein BP5553_06314 [Venustampulla echinocandica]|uniref:2EXR domain-containing protein n=1 Tax=Venustampulla echinocandica TaxID=2656787 RepID=A0A370TJK3_9HELO|nr:uncharacterized protein BP5553_06314 [Venustampulla echinocandica]RDL35702.1 hypothetical protein BP5553_06314 [Venustampulla echinocandica]